MQLVTIFKTVMKVVINLNQFGFKPHDHYSYNFDGMLFQGTHHELYFEKTVHHFQSLPISSREAKKIPFKCAFDQDCITFF